MDLVEGLTGSVDGLEQLMTQSDGLLPALLRLIAGDRDVSKAALNSLINLSQASADPKACNLLTNKRLGWCLHGQWRSALCSPTDVWHMLLCHDVIGTWEDCTISSSNL